MWGPHWIEEIINQLKNCAMNYASFSHFVLDHEVTCFQTKLLPFLSNFSKLGGWQT